jgi:hypothetical protein
MLMINLECKKFNQSTGSYKPHGMQQVSEEEADKLIEIMGKKPVIEGFYRYQFRLRNQVFVIYTLCADLEGFVKSFKG